MKTRTVTPEEFERCVRASPVCRRKSTTPRRRMAFRSGPARWWPPRRFVTTWPGPARPPRSVAAPCLAWRDFRACRCTWWPARRATGPCCMPTCTRWRVFFCVDGRFEITYGDAGEHAIVLEPRDMVAVPPGVTRKFKNVSDQDAHLLVMIQGDANQMGDILYTPEIGEEIVRRFGPGAKAGFEKTGIAFTAGFERGRNDRAGHAGVRARSCGLRMRPCSVCRSSLGRGALPAAGGRPRRCCHRPRRAARCGSRAIRLRRLCS